MSGGGRRAMKAQLAVALALLLGVATIQAVASPVNERVKVEGGWIEGVADTDGLKRYLGVPYAAAPVNERRWAPPAPVEAWPGVLGADRFRSCFEPNKSDTSDFWFAATPRDLMDEDCLHLNVWTRATSTDDRLPVMVWIHGGGLMEGAGALYPGDELTKMGVVLVTINYRLGVFGFFAHPELTEENNGHSGNQGYLDQIAALRWVRDNISNFGGDAGNVTIFGESAGSMSTNVLQASPIARGLFHKVIGQSGARFLPLTYLKQPTSYAPSAEAWGQKMARAFAGGEVLDLASLRKLPAKAIMRRLGAIDEVAKWEWFTIVDGFVLPESVHDIFSQGKQADVPVLIGSNADEASPFHPDMLADLLDPQIATRPDYRSLMAEKVAAVGQPNVPEVGEQAYEHYPVSTPERARQSYIDFVTDYLFTQPMRVWADMMARIKGDVYLYWWNWHPSIQGNTRLKAFHVAEVPYILGNLGLLNQGKIDDLPEERRFSTLMMQIWTNFAKTGNPSVEGLIEWPVYSADNPEMLVLGPRIYRVEGLRAAEVKLITDAFEDRRRGRSKVPE